MRAPGMMVHIDEASRILAGGAGAGGAGATNGRYEHKTPHAERGYKTTLPRSAFRTSLSVQHNCPPPWSTSVPVIVNRIDLQL